MNPISHDPTTIVALLTLIFVVITLVAPAQAKTLMPACAPATVCDAAQ